MTVGIQLRDLIRGVRAETGKSLNVALGVAEHDALVYQIQLKQEFLYYDYDWPALLTHADVPVSAATRLYNYPTGIAFDFINNVWVSLDGTTSFSEVFYGIGPPEYNESGPSNTGWPISSWQISPDGTQFEVWPTPSQTGVVTFYGRRALAPLVDDADTCTLDATLIVLHVAADILARQKAEDAQVKLAQAGKHLRNIVRRQGANKQTPIILGGGCAPNSLSKPVNRNLLWAPGA